LFEFFQLLFKFAALLPALLSSAFGKLIDTLGTPDHLLEAVRDMTRVATIDALDFSVLEKAKLCHFLVEEGFVTLGSTQLKKITSERAAALLMA
jgi:hypothetical protein